MTETRAPRIRTTEVPPASRSIAGVSTSTYALVGLFAKGPVGVPTVVTGLAEAHRLFGRPIANGNGMRAVQLYFAQGGQRAYVTRTAHYKDPAKPNTLTATAATVTLPDNNPNTGKHAGANITIKTAPEKNDSVTLNGVTFTYGTSWPAPKPVSNEHSNDNNSETIPQQQAASSLMQAINSCTNDKIQHVLTARIHDKTPQQVLITAVHTGKALNSIELASSKPNKSVPSAKNLTGGKDSQAKPCLCVQAADGPGKHANGRVICIDKASQGTGFRLTVLQDEQVLDRFDNLTLDPHSLDFVEKRINNRGARFIRVQVQETSRRNISSMDVSNSTNPPWGPAEGTFRLQKGDDGLSDLNDADFIGDSTAATGLLSWTGIDKQFALASIPDRPTPAVTQAALQFARQQQHFLFLPDLPAHLSAQEAVQYTRKHHLHSDYAAVFYPSVVVHDPQEGVLLPNSPALAGCMARTDALPGKGVAKAAAGIEDGRLFGLQALETHATQQQGVRDFLYSHGINPLWIQPGVGIFNDGSQLTRADGMVRFFNERRLLLFLRSSLQEGLHFVLHENICERLYHRINSTVTTFLTRVWQQGGLRGNTAQEAFFVDTSHGPGSINPPEQEQQGQVTVAIGVATLKPTQFVDLTFTLSRSDRAS